MKGRRSVVAGDSAPWRGKGRPYRRLKTSVPRRAVFLDRDGTLIRETHYLSDPSRLALLPGAGQAVAKLKAAGFSVVVVTNQSGIARGFSTEEGLRAIHEKLGRLLARHGACLDGVYACPHHPDGTVEAYRKRCLCRKPGTGLFLQARDDLGIQLDGSYHIGDKRADLEAAARAGLVSILVLSGYGRQEWEACLSGPDSSPMPDRVAAGLSEAADWVLWRECRGGHIRGSNRWLSRRLLPWEASRWRECGRKIFLLLDRPRRVRALLPQPPTGNPLRRWVLIALDPVRAAGELPPEERGRWIARRIGALSRLPGVDAVTLVPQASDFVSLAGAVRADAVLDPSRGGQA